MGVLPPATYRIKNSRSGTYMACSAGDPNIIHGWDSSPDDDLQKWQLIEVGGGYHIRNVGNGRYLASHSGHRNGARVHASPDPTHWEISELDNGTWFISVGGTPFCADLDWGRNHNGVSINLWSRCGMVHKTWRLKRVNSRPSDKLAQSLDETRGRLTAAEKTLKDQQTEISKLKELLSTTQIQLSTAEKSAKDVQRRLSAVESSVTAHKSQLSKLGNQRTTGIGSKASDLREPWDHAETPAPVSQSVGYARGWLGLFGRYTEVPKGAGDTPPQQGAAASTPIEQQPPKRSPDISHGGFYPPPSTPSLSISHPVTGLDSMVPILKPRTDTSETSVAENQEYLVSIGKFLRIMERRVPAIEAKTEKLELSFGQTEGELSALRISSVTTGERLAGLDRRIAMGESRTERIMEALNEIRGAEAGNWPSLGEIPINFPSRA